MTSQSLQSRIDLIENPESRLACVVIIDTSNSMTGRPIRQVNEGLKKFAHDISADELTAARADIAVIAFNNNHRVIQNFGESIDPDTLALEASGAPAWPRQWKLPST